jgi:small GTP-binding protein
MIQKKICMVGAPGVGKTSLVARFVKSIFSDKYLTTVGVKIDKKALHIQDQDITLVLWDLAGEDEFLQLQTSYLRGSAGYLLIADGTRMSTLLKAITLQKKVEDAVGDIPFILVTNKMDMKDQWEITEEALEAPSKSWTVRQTSARTGFGVDLLFDDLTKMMLEKSKGQVK